MKRKRLLDDVTKVTVRVTPDQETGYSLYEADVTLTHILSQPDGCMIDYSEDALLYLMQFPITRLNPAGIHVDDQRRIAMAFQTLAEPRSFYLLADKWDRVRLMQANDWHAQIQAYDIVHHPVIFTPTCINTYFNMKPIFAKTLADISKPNVCHKSALQFVQHLEYLMVADMIDAVLALRSRNIIDGFDAETELHTAERLFRQYPEFAAFSPITGTGDAEFPFLNDISDAANRSATYLWTKTVDQTFRTRVPIRGVGKIINEIAPIILDLCNGWTYRLGIDATHNLHPCHQIAINTLFKSVTDRIFYTFAASDNVDTESTYRDEMPLTEQDRTIIDFRTE